MVDVFISHSSVDRKIAEEVCSYLEKEELNCWISYRVKDLQPGKEYTERIREAINYSKIFVVLLSRNSVASKQVLQEITLANERQRFGMRIFPVVIDETLSIEDVHCFAGYVLAGKEFADWKNKESRLELINQIKLCLSNNSTDKVVHIKSNIPEMNKVIGREKELDLISETLVERFLCPCAKFLMPNIIT